MHQDMVVVAQACLALFDELSSSGAGAITLIQLAMLAAGGKNKGVAKFGDIKTVMPMKLTREMAERVLQLMTVKNFLCEESMTNSFKPEFTNDYIKEGSRAYLLRRNLEVKGNMFLTGTTGTGKTVIVNNVLSRMSKSEDEGGMGVHSINLTFSAQTQSLQTQLTIEDKLEKKRKGVMGPPGTKKIVAVFVDDVNMPLKEAYGAQPPIELLRQWFDNGGWRGRGVRNLTFGTRASSRDRTASTAPS